MACLQHWPDSIKFMLPIRLNVLDAYTFILKCGENLIVVFTISCSGLNFLFIYFSICLICYPYLVYRYIYVPFKRISTGVCWKLAGSAFCFTFVCIWHGTSTSVVIMDLYLIKFLQILMIIYELLIFLDCMVCMQLLRYLY